MVTTPAAKMQVLSSLDVIMCIDSPATPPSNAGMSNSNSNSNSDGDSDGDGDADSQDVAPLQLVQPTAPTGAEKSELAEWSSPHKTIRAHRPSLLGLGPRRVRTNKDNRRASDSDMLMSKFRDFREGAKVGC